MISGWGSKIPHGMAKKLKNLSVHFKWLDCIPCELHLNKCYKNIQRNLPTGDHTEMTVITSQKQSYESRGNVKNRLL